MDKEKPTLVIGGSSSNCGVCGKSADPNEKTHKTIPGYSANRKGCGAEWKQVTGSYVGTEDAIKKMRPDLEYVPFFK